MQHRRSNLLLWLIAVAIGVAPVIVGAGCDQKPELDSERPERAMSELGPVPVTQPTSIELGGNVAGDLRRKAEGGDVQAMLVLGRFHESRDTDKDRAEARKWYQCAADAGEPSGLEAIRHLDARAQQAQTEAQSAASASTAPAAELSLTPSSHPAASAGPIASTEPIDPARTRWTDLTRLIDTRTFLGGAKLDYHGQFIALIQAPDKTITLAAAGPDGDTLTGVTAIVRVRNKLDASTSDRVGQVATLAAYVTRDNVSKHELIDWIQQYLNTGRRSEPMFRNGWRITISGPAAEGKRDDNEHLGAAVMVEMKK